MSNHTLKPEYKFNVGDLVYTKSVIDLSLGKLEDMPIYEIVEVFNKYNMSHVKIGIKSIADTHNIPFSKSIYANNTHLIKIDDKQAIKNYLKSRIADINSFIEGLE